MDTQQLTSLLNNAGLTTSSGGLNWPNLIGGVIFGMIGLVAFMYGKKEKSPKPLVIGIILMAYPYFIPNTWAIYGIGISLSAVLCFWRD